MVCYTTSYTQVLITILNFSVSLDQIICFFPGNMVMDYNLTKGYLYLMQNLTNINTSDVNVSKLFDYIEPIYKHELEESYSVPMVVIGWYIAAASLWCVVSMFVDVVHGYKRNKLWFPCTWFTINAFTLTAIAVAMKLPVDLSGSMPGVVDQVTKLGSMAFMCTMMANLLPCLATMDSKELLTNVTALVVLVITLVINVGIQTNTGVIVKKGKEVDRPLASISSRENGPRELFEVANLTIGNLTAATKKMEVQVIGSISYVTIARIYVIFLVLLLIIYASSSLAIPKIKNIIQQKYRQAASEDVPSTASNPQSETRNFLTVNKLHQQVSNYWIMAGSGSPQFMSACSATTTASGVICISTFIIHAVTIVFAIINEGNRKFGSDYQRSVVVIFIVQSMGVVVGTLAPLSRCVVSRHVKLVFKVEKYWTQMLYDWKNSRISNHGTMSSISLPFRGHKLKVVIKNLKSPILNFCIILQKGVVVVCKITAFVVAFVLDLVCTSKGTRTRTGNLEQRKYVLQLENEDELADKTLEGLLKSLDLLILKGEKKHPENLMKLITEKSTKGFQGVQKYDINDHQDSWSLPVVTLTTIAVTLPNIEKVEVKSLLKSVREGLKYVTLLEKNLNATDESIQKVAARLWEDVDLRRKWLGIGLKDIASQVSKTTSQVDTALQVVKLFSEKAKNKINKAVGSQDDDPRFTSICANSMFGVTETIIGEKESNKRLFDELSSRIADIMAACLTNLPQVIAKKCHTSVIEKREASVEAAAILLGETKPIINTLQGPLQDNYLSMTTNDLTSINKWRAHLSEP
ncbi:hypothetical protein HanPSC8_Chr05g0204001 [Helianthus annuus]|nr:hypothetical protein HanLR1_Chr05g0176601 [Helianthus annuus]KAJ0922454.1 hypothetical protein HanPSC8_Chr05g0204001 [Helianthus annuus]